MNLKKLAQYVQQCKDIGHGKVLIEISDVESLIKLAWAIDKKVNNDPNDKEILKDMLVAYYEVFGDET